jgi:tetratricopeptide (TPR) repeat protein
MVGEWPQMADGYLQMGRVTFELGEYAEAIEYGSKYLQMAAGDEQRQEKSVVFNPNKPAFMAHNLLGGAYYELKQYEKAAEHYRTMLAISESQPDTWSNLAGCMFNLDDVDAAISYWQRSLSLKPDAADVYNNLASAYYKQEKYDQAIAHWRKALELKPDWDEVQAKLEKLIDMKQWLDKITGCEQRIMADPNDAGAYNELATLYYGRGHTAEAIENWEKAVAITPDDADMRGALGTAYYRQGELRRASEQWGKAVELRPDWAAMYNNLAWLLATTADEQLRDGERAVKLAERACELTEYKQAGALDTLGAAYACAGRYDEAAEAAEKGVKLAREAGQAQLAEDIGKHLALYKDGKPYRE